jgi:hypothetical protein
LNAADPWRFAAAFAHRPAHRGAQFRCVSRHSSTPGNEDCNFIPRTAKKALRRLRALAENGRATGWKATQ